MGCGASRFSGLLEDLLGSGLSVEGYEALRAHATTCEACRLEYERISQLETHQERRALPAARQELMEGALFARLGVGSPSDRKVLRPARWSARQLVALAVPVAAALVVAVYLGRDLGAQREETFQARGGGSEQSYGIRAFCVDPRAQVVSEARPGQTLRCARGHSIQFSHTSARRATLTIVGAGNEPLTFFPSEGLAAEVSPGVDVPLPFSTPVTGWLDRPLPVTATFLDGRGKVLGESRLVIAPAEQQ